VYIVNVIEFYLRLVAKRIAPHRKPRQQSPPPGMYVRATYTERDAARRALRGLENTTHSLFSPSKLKVRTLKSLWCKTRLKLVTAKNAVKASSAPSTQKK